jgi:IclR family transcriptional regulator, acetate operon repressor
MKSVINALRVLEAIGDRQPVGVSELARLLEMPKSSVQRCLATLHSQHWIFSSGGDVTHWALTPKVLALGSNVSSQNGLREVAMPILQRLHANVNENTILAVFDSTLLEPVPLISLDSNRALRFIPVVGRRLPFHATAIGKAILSSLPPDERKTLLDRSRVDFASRVNGLGSDDDLDAIGIRGYAISIGEYNEEISSVAAAIVVPQLSTIADPNGVVGAIGISGPSLRLPLDALKALGHEVSKAARQIGRQLGASDVRQ